MPHVMSVPKFEHFFREAAGLDIDKEDLARLDDFINKEIEGLLIRAQAAAKQNLRDVIEPQDLPITKGLQENIEQFRKFDKEFDLKPVLDQMTIRPRLDMDYSVETEARLPEIAGGLSVALAHIFKIIDPRLKNPFGAEWERATKVFNELT
ncbi:MAG: DUF1931 family protein [Gemmatimonadaceae bacterium]